MSSITLDMNKTSMTKVFTKQSLIAVPIIDQNVNCEILYQENVTSHSIIPRSDKDYCNEGAYL